MQILEEQTRQLIYQWNIASTNFDSIRLYLESVYGRELGSGMYHIKSNGLQFAIFDLDTNKNLLPFYGEGEYYFESMPFVFEIPWED
jgi:hypothetical protein